MAESRGNLPAVERLVIWRGVMIRVLARVTLAVTAPLMIWLTREALRLHEPRFLLMIGMASLSTLGCAFAPVSVRTRAWWLVLQSAIIVAIGAPVTGPVAGVGAMIVLTPVLGVLLLGARQAALALGLALISMMLWLELVRVGAAARPLLQLSDAGIPNNALRMVFTSGCVGIIALVASGYMIQKLTTTLTEAEGLIGNLRAEMRAREEETKRRQQVEQELIRSQKMEALARLAGGVAHDVNNNLTVALSCADTIEQAAGNSSKIQRLCASIREACSNASSLTRQLLTLGRRDVSQPEWVSLPKLMDHLEHFLRTSLGKQIRLRFSIPENVPAVYVDPHQLEQVLINLAINARDAMPNGGELSITADDDGSPRQHDFTTSADAPAHAVRLHVQDQGTGIEPALLGRIVEPFFTTKDAEHGTGLGLSVVRAFAEASGGRLCIDSKLGHGSCFTLELPAASQRVAQPRIEPAATAAPTRGTTVLVVDDDARVRETIVAGLEHAGYRALAADDGEAALECARHAGHVDLLCTDAVMPRMGGEELIRRLHQLDPSTRVLVCSAYVQDEALRELLRSGHYPALAKPFSQAQLLDSVARALSSPAAEG